MTYKESIIKEITGDDYHHVSDTEYKNQYGSEHEYIIYEWVHNLSEIEQELDNKGIKYKKSYPTHFEHGFILI